MSDKQKGTPAKDAAKAAAAEDPSRREFLRSGMFGTIGLFATQAALGGGVMFWPAKVTGFGAKIEAGNVADLKVGDVKRIGEGRFYLSRTQNGLMALYWKCVHLGCTVPYVPERNLFICPCHGSTYEKTGQNIAGPAPRPLDIMAIDVQSGGKIVVDTGKVRQRARHDESHETKV